MVPAASTAPGPTDELPRAQERLAIAALALAAFALNLNTNVLGALLPFVRADLTLADRDAEVLLAASALGSAVGALGVGPLAARFGRRRLLVLGLGAFVVLSLLHLGAASFWPFLALRALSGVGVGVAYAAASALAAEVAPYARRGAAMGWFNAGMFLAIPIGMPLSVALAVQGHWNAIFAVQAGVGALGCWWALRAVPSRAARAPSPAAGGALATGWLPTLRRAASFFGPVLSSPAVCAGLFATMLHVGSFFTTVQLASSWLDQSGRMAKEDQIVLWVGLGFASVAGSALFGRLSDRLGKRTFVMATSIVLVACFGALALQPGPVVLLVVGTLLAMTAAARTGPLQALVSGLVPAEHMGSLMGLRGAVMQFGVFAFAMAARPVADALQFQGVLWLAAGCQLLSFASIRFWVREGG